jgi:hypothetical protein
MTQMNASQIAGLFLTQALERINKGNDMIAKQNLQNFGWASMFLSEKQYNWIAGQLERDERRARGNSASLFNVVKDNQVVGSWEVKIVEGRNKIFYSLNTDKVLA